MATAFQVHKCKFVEYPAHQITATSFSHSGKFVAVARSNGSIEIWNIIDQWFLQQIIPGEGPEFAARSLLWVPSSLDAPQESQSSDLIINERLFSSGLAGEIVEWDLSNLIPKDKTIVGAGGIWQMSGVISDFISDVDDGIIEKQYRICVGCEDGRVRIYQVMESGPCFLRSTSLRQPARVLCVAWHPNGKFVCAGDSEGNIRILQSESCKQKYRMTSGTSRSQSTRIWSLVFLSDGIIVSGNSFGDTEFWDSSVGVQLQSLRTHFNDIISMAATKNENTLIIAGINSKIVKVNRTNDRWVIELGRKLHSHDISCVSLSHNDEWIVSGGLDKLLIRQKLKKMEPERTYNETQRLYPFPHYPVFSSTKGNYPLVLTHSDTILQLWGMGKAFRDDVSQTSYMNFKELQLEQFVHQVLQLDLKSSFPIYCSSIDPNEQFIAASDTTKLYIFACIYDEEKVNLKKVHIKRIPTSGIIRMEFSSAGQLILAYSSGSIIVVDLNTKKFKEFTDHCYSNHGTIHSLTTSEDGQWLATSDTQNHIHVYNLDTMKLYSTLPKFNSIVTAMKFSPQVDPMLTIACGNSVIYQYDVENGDLSNWSKKNSDRLPDYYLNVKGVITNITFNPLNPSLCFLVSAVNLIKLDFTKPLTYLDSYQPSTTKRKRDGTLKQVPLSELPSNLTIISNYRPILYAGFIASSELIVIQIPKANLVKDLPAPVYHRRSFY